jgi:hypothetical protein
LAAPPLPPEQSPIIAIRATNCNKSKV